jgi:hypothetical protein
MEVRMMAGAKANVLVAGNQDNVGAELSSS